MTEQVRPIDDRRFKGLPRPAGVPVTGIGDLGWNALRDLECPVLVLHEEQLVHNITTMADYCRHHRVELAPHAKASLSPQLIRRQIEAGPRGDRRDSGAGQGSAGYRSPSYSAGESACRSCCDPLDCDPCARSGRHGLLLLVIEGLDEVEQEPRKGSLRRQVTR